MRAFAKSQSFAFRRVAYDAIAKSDLTKSEQAILRKIAAQWFHHWGKSAPVIYPGRESLAKGARVSIRTVASALAKFRSAGVLSVVARPNGEGQKPTVYRLNIAALFVLCGSDVTDLLGLNMLGVFGVELHTKLHTKTDKVACKNCTQLKDTSESDFLCHDQNQFLGESPR